MIEVIREIVENTIKLENIFKLGKIVSVNPQKLLVNVQELGFKTVRRNVPICWLFGGIIKIPKGGEWCLLLNLFGKHFVVASFPDVFSQRGFNCNYEKDEVILKNDNCRIRMKNDGEMIFTNNNGYGFKIQSDGKMVFWSESVEWHVGDGEKYEE